MAFANASNVTVHDTKFNDISGDQIKFNHGIYTVPITSATQYEALVNAISESVGRQGSEQNHPSPSENKTAEARLCDILDQAVSAGTQPLNWRESIVDLMKLLKLDSSLDARKALAFNHGYRGDPGNSYARNVWLREQIMALLRKNGGNLEVVRVMIESVNDENREDFDATTCWIAAEQALHHIRSKVSELANIFSRRNIPQSEYAAYAGFDESLIRAGVGFLEQIHIFVSEKVDPTSDLLSELEGIFLPFSSVLFTQSSSHVVSLPQNIQNPWECGELPSPTVISMASHTHGTVGGPRGFAQGGSGNGEGGGNKNERSEKGKERDDGDGDEVDKEGNDDKDSSESASHGSRSIGDPRITFEIRSKIHSINNSHKPVQTLAMQGALTIKTTSPDFQHQERRIQFQMLKFDAKPRGMEFKQSFARVIVDSRSHTALFKDIKPQSTPEYDRKEKEFSTTTNSWGHTWSGGLNAGPNPMGTVGLSSMHAHTVSQGSEKQRNTSGITQQDGEGSVQWDFEIDDPKEQEQGIKMVGNSDILPSVTFEFFGSSQTLPERADIEIMSCWSLFPDTSSPRPSNCFLGILRKFFRSSDGTQTPSYSNLCHITALETFPSALPPHSHYVANLYPVRNITGYSYLPRDNIEVQHDSGPAVVVKPDLNSDRLSVIQSPDLLSEQGRDCANANLNKRIEFKLPSITKVKLPDNPEHVLEDMGSSTINEGR